MILYFLKTHVSVILYIATIIILLSVFTNTLQDRDDFYGNQIDSLTLNVTKRIDQLQAGISKDIQRNWKIVGIEKYIGEINRNIKYSVRYSYATFIVDQAEIYDNIDAELITSVIRQESYFRKGAVSHADAAGLMGIMPETGMWICKELGIHYDSRILLIPEVNIKLGSWYLSYLKRTYNNTELALAHYNGGRRQKNRYINKSRYQHTRDFKNNSIADLRQSLRTMKDSLGTKVENKKTKEGKRYTRLTKVLSGKLLASETKNYVPQVLTRRNSIIEFLKESPFPADTINVTMKN